MASNSPGDEVAEEYGDYSKYIQLDLTSQQTGDSIELHELNARTLSEDKYARLKNTGPNPKNVPHNITSKGVAYAVPNKAAQAEEIDYDEKYRRPDRSDAGVPNQKTNTGQLYAVPNKLKPYQQVSQEDDDDKYMNIDEMEAEREPDYVAPDVDEIQPYNTYTQPDNWGDGSFNSTQEDDFKVQETNVKGKIITFLSIFEQKILIH